MIKNLYKWNVICLYLKVFKNFMRFTCKDRFWFVKYITSDEHQTFLVNKQIQ